MIFTHIAMQHSGGGFQPRNLTKLEYSLQLATGRLQTPLEQLECQVLMSAVGSVVSSVEARQDGCRVTWMGFKKQTQVHEHDLITSADMI